MNYSGWIVGLVLSGVIGLGIGSHHGAESARGKVATDCRKIGGFVVKRTAFECGVIHAK